MISAPLLEELGKAKARVERRHSWRSFGKAKGAYQKWSFGEGDTNILKDKPDTFFGKLKDFTKRKGHQGKMAAKDAVTLGAATRNAKKERYGIRVGDNPHENLDITDLDAGLHEFIRSAVNHYWLAKTAAAKLYPAQVLMWKRDGKQFSADRTPPTPPAQTTELTGDDLINTYAQFRHDLHKARIYLYACQKLAAFCYVEIGLSTASVGVEGKVFERTYKALPGVSPKLFESDNLDIRVPSNALCTRTKNLQNYIEGRLAARNAAQNQTAWPPDRAETPFQLAALERMKKLNNPGKMHQLAHHYRRELKEADRREKVMAGGAVTGAIAVRSSPQLVIGIAIVGVAVRPAKMVFKKVGGQIAKALLCLLKMDRETDSDVLLAPDQIAQDIHSAERLDQSELQSFGRKIDERILAAARHINDAYGHLDALAELDPENQASNQIVPLLEEDGPPATLSKKQADLFYEVAHDLEKGMRYLNQITIFECSLDLALSSLETADRENFHQLDDDFAANASAGGGDD